MPERLRNTRRRAVGARQTVRALHSELVQVVYVAGDAEVRIVHPVVELARTCAGVEVVEVENMNQLGRLCGISVGAACAALLKDATVAKIPVISGLEGGEQKCPQ